MATLVNDLVSFLQCGETIAIRDAVRIDPADGKIYKFDPTNSAHVFAGIAKEGGVLNDFIRVVQSGRVRGFSGLTAGGLVYASVTTPGSFQLTEPASSQRTVLGIAKSATELTVNGALGIKPGGEGGSGGGLDVFYTETMEALANTSTFATGNNATFLGGGTLQGTLALETSAPISALKSLKYTMAAGSLNDYFASPLIDLDLKQRDETCGMTLYFTYNGNDNDMKFVVWDVTNSREISNQVSFVKLANQPTRYSLSFYVPQSCTQIRWGAQVLVANSGKILLVDDVEMSTDPFQYKELSRADRVIVKTFSSGTSWYEIYNDGWIRQGGKSGTTATFHVQMRDTNYTAFMNGNNASVPSNYGGNIVSFSTTQMSASETYANGYFWTVVGYANTASLAALGVFITPPTTENILTPSDTFSTDTAPLTYASSSQFTLSTLANAPIGTYITFTYAANTNTRTQTTTRPTQTDADMNVNGIRIYTRAYNAASTATEPAAIAIQIGKGLKGLNLGLYKSAGKTTTGEVDYYLAGSDSVARGIRHKDYDEKTGILFIDTAPAPSTVTSANFDFSDLTQQTSGYLVINASKTLPLLAVPTPLTAYLKDVKPSGTAGGTFTAGAWQTRTLNTVEGDSSIVSLSANQVILGPGRYEIEAEAPAYLVAQHQLKLRNITDATDTLLGQSVSSATTNGDVTISRLTGVISLTSSKVFEIQHRCNTTGTTTGFGIAANFGVSEVYAQLKIKKIG